VVEKDRSNFCDYFSFADRAVDTSSPSGHDKKQEAMKKLDDLFK
jgi:hypothetical protein